jgi:excisionase family DNA binding protein
VAGNETFGVEYDFHARDADTLIALHRQVLTIGEVAARLRMSTKSVRRRIKSGVIRAAPTGGRLVRVALHWAR